MDEDIVVPLGFFITIITCVVVFVVASVVEKVMAAKQRAVPLTPELDARLERLEQAIETVAVEVERLAEGQRFTSRLLSERPEALAIPSSTTPEHPEASRHA